MANSEAPCWCFEVEVPQKLIDLVPNDKKRKSCICLTCIQSFKDDPDTFQVK